MSPLQLEFKKAGKGTASEPINFFSSYSFDSNILTPASAFRFTIPDIDKDKRMKIRSGDTVYIFAIDSNGNKVQIATGFVDETDTHITPNAIEYVLTGRDVLSQFVDNDAISADNKIINTKNLTLKQIVDELKKFTRLENTDVVSRQVPDVQLLFQTNPGESKLTSLQRYLELTNCLVWGNSDGKIIIGKPTFKKGNLGFLKLNYSQNAHENNILEARVKRSPNLSTRKVVYMLQTLEQVYAGTYAQENQDKDMLALKGTMVGRSIYRPFTYGSGSDVVNQISAVGNQDSSDKKIGTELAQREIARENMKVLEVEVVVEGHLNSSGNPYGIDQIYEVQIEDENVFEELYVYACTYELTLEHGMITRMRLCRRGTICASGEML